MTIRRGTKEHKRAIEGAKLVKRFDLNNAFEGTFVCGLSDDAVISGKLIKLMNRYVLRIHSNLWYEWSVA